MKREIFAAVLLITMLICSIINTNQISTLTKTVENYVEKAEESAKKGLWDDGLEHAQAALSVWQNASTYTGIVLRHEKSETTADALLDFIKEIKLRDILNVSSSAEKLKGMLQNIRSMESIKLSSIF